MLKIFDSFWMLSKIKRMSEYFISNVVDFEKFYTFAAQFFN